MKSRMVRLGSNGSFISTLSTESARPPPQTGLHSVLEGGESRVPESESGRTVTTGRGESDDKMRKNVIESMWKTVMEPALEYSFVRFLALSYYVPTFFIFAHKSNPELLEFHSWIINPT